MATARLALKFRSVTYPAYENKSKNRFNKSSSSNSCSSSRSSSVDRDQLRRMSSFDESDNSSLIGIGSEDSYRRRDMSLEGRSRARVFKQRWHSESTDSTTTVSSSSSCDLNHVHIHSHQMTQPLSSPKSRHGAKFGATLGSHTERLLDWRRISPERHHSVERPYSYDILQRRRSPERRTPDNAYCVRRRRLYFSSSVPSTSTRSHTPKYSHQTEGDTAVIAVNTISSEGQRRRLSFRRALSLFSLAFSSSKDHERGRKEEKSPQKRILRAPTRHVYRRGISGLPVECSSQRIALTC